MGLTGDPRDVLLWVSLRPRPFFEASLVSVETVLSQDPSWRQNGVTPVNLSIKNAPGHVVVRLRRRAERNRRSLQGDLLAIIEAAALIRADRGGR